MGVIVWGHAHTGLHLPLCLYEPERKSIYCMRHLRCPECFPCANRLTRSRNRRHSHLNCSHTDTLMQFLCSSLFATLFLPRTQNVSISLQCPPPTPHLQTNTHMHIHTTFSPTHRGESRKQLEKQIVTGRLSPGPLPLTHDWTFTWMDAVLTLIFQLQSKSTQSSAIAQT